MFARDLMSKDIVTVRPDAAANAVGKILETVRAAGAAVAGPDGTIVGVVTWADIPADKHKKVEAVMHSDFEKVTEDAPVEAVARLMASRKLELVAVFSGDTIIGMISQDDIVTAVGLGLHPALQTPLYDL
jgi:CBS domain-containing membrane protein